MRFMLRVVAALGVHVTVDCCGVVGLVLVSAVPGDRASSSYKGGEISSCNYVARQFGVRAGMWVAAASKRCPGVVVLPYNFDKIKEVSTTLYKILCEVRRGPLCVSNTRRPHLLAPMGPFCNCR